MNGSAVGNYGNFTNTTQASIHHETANNTSGNTTTSILKTGLRSAQMTPYGISNWTFHRFDEKPSLRDQVSKVEQCTNRNTRKVVTRREALQRVAKAPPKTTLKSNDDADAINRKSGKSHAPRLPFLARQSVSQQISADDFISRSASKNATVVDNTLQDGFTVEKQIRSRPDRSTTDGIWHHSASDLPSGKRVDILVEKLDKCVEENDQVSENIKLARCIAKEAASTIIQTCLSQITELPTCTLGAMRQLDITYQVQNKFAVENQIKSRPDRSTAVGIWHQSTPALHSGKRVDILVEKLDKCVEENDRVSESKKLAKCIAKETTSTIVQTCLSEITELPTCTLGAMRQQNIAYEEVLITTIGEAAVNAEKNGIYPQGTGQNWADVLDWVDAEYAKSGAAEAANEARLDFVSKEIKWDNVDLNKINSVKDIIRAIPRSRWHLRYWMDEMKRAEALLEILNARYVDQPLTLNRVTYVEAEKNLSRDKLNRLSKPNSYQCLKKTVTALLERLHGEKVVKILYRPSFDV